MANTPKIHIITGETLNRNAYLIEQIAANEFLLNGFEVKFIECPTYMRHCEYSAMNSRTIFGLRVHNGTCQRCKVNSKKFSSKRSFGQIIRFDNNERLPLTFGEIENCAKSAVLRASMKSQFESLTKYELKIFSKVKLELERYKFGLIRYFEDHYQNGDVILFKHGVYALHGTVKSVLDQLELPYFVWDTCYKPKSIVIAANNRPDWYVSELTLQQLPKLDREEADIVLHNLLKKAGWHHPKSTTTDIKTVGVFANTVWDANNWYEGKYLKTHSDFLNSILNLAISFPDLNFEILPHPVEGRNDFVAQETVREALMSMTDQKIPNNMHIHEAGENSFQVAANCDLGIVFGSTIGAELAALGLPIVIFGNAGFQNKDIGFDINSKKDIQQLHKILSSRYLEETSNRAQNALRYLSFMQNDFPITLDHLPVNIRSAKANESISEEQYYKQVNEKRIYSSIMSNTADRK